MFVLILFSQKPHGQAKRLQKRLNAGDIAYDNKYDRSMGNMHTTVVLSVLRV
jgi:hypothetical protein